MSLLEEKFAKTYTPSAGIYYFTWTLANYKRLVNYKAAGEFVQSPNFVLYNQSSYIRLYPKGNYQAGTLDFVSASMHFEKTKEKISNQSSSLKPVKANVFFSILTKSGKKRYARSGTILILKPLNDWSIPNFIKNSEIMDPKSDFLIDDSIKLRFDLNIFFEETHVSCNSIMSSTAAETNNIINYMEKLFLQTDFSDIKFVTSDGGELPAHKIILASRLPYFEKMFQSNMKENLTNKVEITDIEFNVFKEILRFIYTGKVEDIGAVALNLIKAADKYDIDNLKNKCAEHLSEAMTIENVIEILVVADGYNVNYLKNQAIYFIKANFAKIITLNNFKTTALASKPSLLVEIMQSFK